MKMKTQQLKISMGYSESSSKKEVYSNTILPQETKKNLIDNLTTSKTTGKRRTKKKKPKIIRRKEIIKIFGKWLSTDQAADRD